VLESGELVDREEEVAAVLETIREGKKLFLIGPRRYGKTSILKAATRIFCAKKNWTEQFACALRTPSFGNGLCCSRLASNEAPCAAGSDNFTIDV
jgi:hypothetical protein